MSNIALIYRAFVCSCVVPFVCSSLPPFVQFRTIRPSSPGQSQPITQRSAIQRRHSHIHSQDMSADSAASPVDASASSLADSAPVAAAAAPLPVSSPSFSTPHFHSLQWRLDVQRYSRTGGDMAVPTAIVQLQTKQQHGSVGGATEPPQQLQQLQFEMDRTTAAHVMLQFEKIDAIMAGAQ